MKKIFLPLLVLLLAGGAYYLYHQQEAATEDNRLTLYGNVDIRDVALGFRVAGRITQMRFEEGDAVKQGEVLAVLDQQPFLDDLALANAELAEAKVTFVNAAKLFRRRAELLKTGAVAKEQYDDAMANRDVVRARRVRAEAQLDLVKTQLADTELRAPQAGIVLTRVTEPGSVVAQGASVYTLALSHPLWVRTYVDEPFLGRVYPGQRASVTTDAGREYTGQVGFISPQAEFTPKSVETSQLRTSLVYRLRIIVDTPDNGLRQGMPVTVHLSPDAAGAADGK